MWPTDIERVRYSNRNGHAAYLEWLCEKTNTPFKAAMMNVRTRPEIDELFKPDWVNVAEEVLSTHTDFADSAHPPVSEYERQMDEIQEMIQEAADRGPIQEEPQPEPEPEPEPEETPPVEEPTMAMGDYSSYTVRELQEECRRREITIRGTKAEVVMRLRRHDEGLLDTPDEDKAEAPAEEAAAKDESDAPAEEAAATIGDEDAPDSGQEQTNDTDE